MHDFTQKQQSKSNSIAPSYTPSKPKHSDIMAQRADYLQQYDLKDVGKAMQAYYQRKLSPEAKQSYKLDQNIHNPNTQSFVPEVQPSLDESDVQESPSSVQMKHQPPHEDNLQQYSDSASSQKPAQSIHEIARTGFSGSPTTLPHLEQIQQSLGVDLSHVQAYIGGPAEVACQNIGALAFASGNNIAFGKPPGIELATHEATHTVQQASGKVDLPGGVGHVGDKYETHADLVAATVARGQSAVPLMADYINATTQPPLQHSANFQPNQEQEHTHTSSTHEEGIQGKQTEQNSIPVALHNNTNHMSPKLIHNLFTLKEKLGIFGKTFFELSTGAIYQYCVNNTIDFPFYKLFPGAESNLNGQTPADYLSKTYYPFFNLGRQIGDIATLYTALGEIEIGSGMDGTGILGTPETGGASLVLTVPGTALIIHGASSSLRSLADLFNQHGIIFHIEGNPEKNSGEVNTERPWKRNTNTYHGSKPDYENPGHHDPSSPKFRGGGSMTSKLPSDAEEVYKHAIPTKDGETWWGRNSEGEYYRYQGENNVVHWNGSFKANDPKIPTYIKRRFKSYDTDRIR